MPGAVRAQIGDDAATATPPLDPPDAAGPAGDAPAEVAATPTWHAGRATPDPGAAAAASAAVAAQSGPRPATGREGLELARAYLDLGDDEAARGLLREVLSGHDPAAREEAARLLRELG
jgi:pilus assembly protein FimV